ncbi:MAG: hypothetical protein CML45_00630 [Rhodobacteraceae bacterium]|nr:hypothetical protein [Paracoccaceae bacterium]
MAFLDNSGDIILDAVLTDTGRKQMAKGEFSISKFSIGDDEIDYGLYNKDHPSGSAYYDLEILQTPILEAFTQINANINYGLLSYPRQDLLYLPTIKLNEKAGTAATVSSRGVIYIADNSTVIPGTSTTTAKSLEADLGSDKSIINSGDRGSGKFIFIETGIDTPDGSPVGSSTNQSNYILSVDLADNNFLVSYNTSWFDSIQGPDTGSDFSNNTAKSEAILSVTMTDGVASSTSTEVESYASADINGLLNRVYYVNDGNVDLSTTYSAINGPRASFTAISVTLSDNIAQSDYESFGRLAQTQGGTQTYDYIDSILYVKGASTQVTLQLPVRIIKISA